MNFEVSSHSKVRWPCLEFDLFVWTLGIGLWKNALPWRFLIPRVWITNPLRSADHSAQSVVAIG